MTRSCLIHADTLGKALGVVRPFGQRTHYDHCLAETPWKLPVCQPDAGHVHHLCVARGAARDGVQDYLRLHGVGTAIHYPVPIDQQPAYRDRLPIGAGGLKNTNMACREIISLPMHPHLTACEVERIGNLSVVTQEARLGCLTVFSCNPLLKATRTGAALHLNRIVSSSGSYQPIPQRASQ